MPQTTDLSEQPLTFDAESSKQTRLESSAFRGRVPVVLAFVGEHGPRADAAIVCLNASLLRFGERRVQLLVVVDGYPTEVAARLSATVTLITDDGLAEELHAEVDAQGQLCSVVVGNDGQILETVRQLPADDPAPAILSTVDRLAAAFPDRFSTLPELDENAERTVDPTSPLTDGSKATFRQRLAWLTGDRKKEAEALAGTVAGPIVAAEAVLAAANQAVSDAHGDSHVEETDPVTTDVASPADVIEKL